MDAEGPDADGSIRRACDQCRLRKIRCDKESPCSNCRSARRSCSSTGAGQKPKEHRQRVLISSQYERKIDQIESRLGGIETLLRNLSPISGASSSSKATPSSSEHTAVSGPSPYAHRPSSSHDDDETASTVYDQDDAESHFEGNSAMSAHTVFASQFLENAVQRTSLQGASPKIDAALNSLKHLVDMQEKRPKHHEARVQGRIAMKGSLRELPMPPMDLVIEELRKMKRSPGPVMMAVICSFVDMEVFMDRCRRLYFNVDDPAEAQFIIVNVGLAYVFFEAALGTNDPELRKKYTDCSDMCERNSEIALSRLPLIMPASLENIEALLMATTFYIELSRPSLGWLFVTRAAHMCNLLGYNNGASMANDPPRLRADKTLMFWCTYMLEKGLALRLGRSSIIQDHDISLPRSLQKTYTEPPGDQIFSLWIKHAEIQGHIYQRLYSPGALRESNVIRQQQVDRLAAETRALLTRTQQLMTEVGDDPSKRLFAQLLKSDEVSYFSSLALIYRALPGPGTQSRTFVDECLNTTRDAIDSHLSAMTLMTGVSEKLVYVHWTIIYAPFIPFIVMFCYVIETLDTTALERLGSFVESLDMPHSISPGIDKLYRLCQVLTNVAVLYVEAKAQQPTDQDTGMVGTEFDMYLSQLGFMPNADGSMAGMTLDDQARNVAQTTQLGDWFSGNNYVLGLLEEDMSMFNPASWPSQGPG